MAFSDCIIILVLKLLNLAFNRNKFIYRMKYTAEEQKMNAVF